jgi:hypothetical protein
MRDRGAEKFRVVLRESPEGNILRTWGPYERSYALSLCADKSREDWQGHYTVEPLPERTPAR